VNGRATISAYPKLSKRFKGTFGAGEVPVRIYYFERLPTAATEAKCYDAAKQAIRAVMWFARAGR
jgi:hypothetical protein